MVKNDYRRSLLMLRSHERGYSGHVRLERRTLIGSMYFAVGAPSGSGELCAALIRRDARGAYYAAKLGALRYDGRGQATLACSFDPRNIDGFALEDYLLIAIVHRDAENCSVVLSGNVNGSQEVSWNSVRAAACSVCARQPACEMCSPVQPRTPDEAREETQVSETEAESAARTQREARADEPDEAEQGTDSPDEPQHENVSAQAESGDEPTAGENLGVDMSVPWPGMSESLRALFAAQPASELMLSDGYTYVRAPMPEDSGFDEVYIGVRAHNGAPSAVKYALPAAYSIETPPGLEGYRWEGGAQQGWWTLETDPETGRSIVGE